MSTASTALRSRAWVEVNLAALRANLREVQAAIGPGTALLPMVKADAYGLGMARVVEAVLTEMGPAGPWGFGVAAVAEGERLRQIGWGGRILVLSPALPDEFRRAAHANLTLSFSGMDGVRAWAAAADEIGTRLPFHTEVDTGMGRAGFPCEEAGAWSPRVAEAAGGGLFWEGCFTHFHSADELDLAPTDAQWERFRAALSSFPPRREGDPPLLIHADNSAASLRRGGFRCDLARPGIFLYGGEAGPGSRPQPVVAVRARLSQVREVPSGATLGYGATYAAARAEIWGTAAIGYGDGLRRALVPSGGEAIVHGVRVPLVGRISMDVSVLHLSQVPEAKLGDVVTFIGRDGDEEIRVDEVAERCGTISYEILTGLTARVPRVYLDGPAGAGTLQDG